VVIHPTRAIYGIVGFFCLGFDKLKNLWTNLSLADKIGILLIIGFGCSASFSQRSGWDYIAAFRADTLAGVTARHTWNPYPTYWLIYPFAIMPERVGFFFWNLVNAICFIYAIYYWRGNFLGFSLSLPLFWTYYSGQMEGFISLGIVLGLSQSPLLAGFGLALLTIKPQLGILPVLFILYRRRDWQLLIVPVLIYGASFLYWGWWIPQWLYDLHGKGDASVIFPTNISLFPYSLILLSLLWWTRKSLKAWLLIESLVITYFPVYSLAVVFCLEIPTWANVFLWLVYISANFIQYPTVTWLPYTAIPGFLIPVGMLGKELLDLNRSSRSVAL